MPTEKKPDELLTSWKGIAAYLDCYERTCRRWERTLGLPVHRIEGASKSRIFAYKEELDLWRLEKLKNGNSSAEQIQGSKRRFKWQKGYLFALIIPVTILLLFFSNKLVFPHQPADFSISGSSLIIKNEKGRELWRHDTGIENLCDEKEYRLHFQQKRLGESGSVLGAYLVIKDLNRDGKNEILFSIQTEDEIGEGALLCFASGGQLLWKFKSGREIQYGNNQKLSEYRIRALGVFDFENNADYKIVVLAIQRYEFPCQATILNNKGEILGEYWNSGYLNDMTCFDINRDNKKEILLAGNNNEYKKGCIVVFDPSRMAGASPQQEDNFKCRELGRGSEMYYMLLPRSDADLATNYPVEGVNVITNHMSQEFSVITGLSKITYFFSYDMALKQIFLSHFFYQMHKTAFQQGKIKSILNETYMENLKKGILYWNGENWVSRPTMNRHWKDTAQKQMNVVMNRD